MQRGKPGAGQGRGRIVAAIFALALAVGAGVAHAEQPLPDDPARLRAEADLLFKQILVRPNNLDAAFRYAEIETRLGDFEAAIGALERMLFYNPNLPRVKLELGLLYFRLGSYEMARSYFEAASSGPNVPDDVRGRVASFLAEIDRRLSASQFAAFAQTGFRYQTNANAGPQSDIVRALGQDATLSSQFRRRGDWNWFITGSFHHVFDFGDQRGTVWETDGVAYYARQFQVTTLNLGIVEASTGPRFAIGDATGLSFHPYLLANDVTLGDRQYFATGGAGGSLRYLMSFGAAVEPLVEFRARSFANSGPYPTATNQTGDQTIAAVGVSGPLFLDNFTWQARFSYTNDTAHYHPYAYDQFGIELAVPYQFTGFIGDRSRVWTFAPFASFFDVGYAAADPIVDPAVKRHDQLYRFGATLDTALWRNFGFALTLEYDRTNSNLPNYRMSDFIVSGGPTVRF
ncbi:MAG: hypothetical protein JOY94_11715 [Methylobacteriaceae bacterium]|nr:hypothetical protein [Methylobacteriaceae bacterium]